MRTVELERTESRMKLGEGNRLESRDRRGEGSDQPSRKQEGEGPEQTAHCERKSSETKGSDGPHAGNAEKVEATEVERGEKRRSF